MDLALTFLCTWPSSLSGASPSQCMTHGEEVPLLSETEISHNGTGYGGIQLGYRILTIRACSYFDVPGLQSKDQGGDLIVLHS